MHNYNPPRLTVSQNDNLVLSEVTFEHGIQTRNRFLTTCCEQHVNLTFTR